jgi:hypothetical protein
VIGNAGWPSQMGKFNIRPYGKIFKNYSYLKSLTHLTENFVGMCLELSLTNYVLFVLNRNTMYKMTTTRITIWENQSNIFFSQKQLL